MQQQYIVSRTIFNLFVIQHHTQQLYTFKLMHMKKKLEGGGFVEI